MEISLLAVHWADPSLWIAILEVAVGLGFIIFVHELGHFAVAKWCGVKVEKFMIGFDIGGIKLAKFQRGETLYGIGILPLGGYVKMLGQEDNPARLREEIERAKQAAAAGSQGGGEGAKGRGGEEKPRDCVAGLEQAATPDLAHAQQALFDPRSYLAKSVPARMAIISAGVIMNLIFAFVLAVAAFGVGVRQPRCIVGKTLPGWGAWQAGLRAGDEILSVNGQKVHTFTDMRELITLGDAKTGVKVLVKRPGQNEPLEFTVKTKDVMGGLLGIGIVSASEPVLAAEKYSHPVLPGSAASQTNPGFQLGDRFLKVNGKPVETGAQLQAILATHAAAPLEVTVQRAKDLKGQERNEKAEGGGEQATIRVAPNPVRQFGLVMTMGTISAIQQDSSATKAGVEPGDVLKTLDGKPVGDPMTLPSRLRKQVGQTVTLGVQRPGKKDPVEIRIEVRPSDQYNPSENPNSPVGVPELGIAYRVTNTVQSVDAGSPAAEAGLQAGDVLRSAKIVPPDAAKIKEIQDKYHQTDLAGSQREITIDFDADSANWPLLMDVLQDSLPGTTINLEWSRGEDKKAEKMKVEKMEPVLADGWYTVNRGWNFKPNTFVQIADTPGEAFHLGGKATANAALVVYRTLFKIGSGDVSVRNLSGPIGIVDIALQQAQAGMGNFLLFLTLLSANLAVVNFLPIPLLDGGHMLLLLWEGVRGKPASEQVQEVLTYIGLAFVLGLMILVFGLDLGWIPRPGVH